MNRDQIQTHVPIVGWLLIAQSAILLLIAVFLLFLLVGIGFAIQDRTATPIMSIVGISLAVFMLLLALPGLIAGGGVLARKTWARTLAIVVAIFGLVNIPVGTMIGAYALWVLLQDSATDYFAAMKEGNAQ